jgi:hypothetical protein
MMSRRGLANAEVVMRRASLAFLVTMMGALAFGASSAVGEAPLVFTTVEHNVTLGSEHFPDDACGPRAVTETDDDCGRRTEGRAGGHELPVKLM